MVHYPILKTMGQLAMRNLMVCALGVCFALFQIFGVHAQTQSPPGAGHGFLIDKHVAAKVTCAQCHTQSTAKAPDTPTCLSCHGGTYAKLAEMTKGDQPNPHLSHRGEEPCASCHHVHMASVTLCNQCHTYDMTTP